MRPQVVDLPQRLNVPNPVLTIGTFDGVHRAHQTLLALTRHYAQKWNGTPVLVTFHPHPRQVLNGQDAPKLLTTWNEKEMLLGYMGIPYIVRIPFTKDFALLPPETYVREVLYQHLHPRAIVIGYNHRFGAGRQGDIHLLRTMGQALGFEVVEVPKQMVDDIRISSTQIRKFIQEGLLEKANLLLGYPYLIEGTITPGKRLGHRLGFPTLNLPVPAEKILPPKGVYAGRVFLPDQQRYYNAIFNLGQRPTVSRDNTLWLEAHLLDIRIDDLYGKPARAYLLHFIRPEQRFHSTDELRTQIQKDIQHAARLLASS